ncbi:hypothetical protein Echvi_0640 [Echinicola vietnamensis DSM 17526]|uniref:Uncharacterized protein n=1 Tax=Echinicola vietnamensis (strain DSM 17526 / LMG 23754 / KMM 6221) TaxID=926556 RepID=L0FV61_ECHVK|nr:hypothetical protein Echvi_0640 [Echinicola vietnamensis DSM 17526]
MFLFLGIKRKVGDCQFYLMAKPDQAIFLGIRMLTWSYEIEFHTDKTMDFRHRANALKQMFLFAFIFAVPTELPLLCVIIFGAGGHLQLLYDPPPKAD